MKNGFNYARTSGPGCLQQMKIFKDKLKIQKFMMPNQNYVKGRRKEYRIVEKFRKADCEIVFRSAGSHSPIDVVAINKENKRIYFIQCKPDSLSESAKKKLEDTQEELIGLYECEFLVL